MTVSAVPRELILLAVHASDGNVGEMQKLISSAAFRRVPSRAVTETILEIHLFTGFPAAIEAFILLRPYFKRRASKNHADTRSRGFHRVRGIRVCRQVYGENFDKLMTHIRTLNPDLARWIIEDGYGKVLGRPGLSMLHRELIAIGVLAAGGWFRQLESHLRGAVNVGGRPQTLLKTLHIVRPCLKVGTGSEVERLFTRVLGRAKIPKRT